MDRNVCGYEIKFSYTFAAQQSLNKGLRVAFSGGTVMGFMVVGLGLLEMATWFVILKWYYTVNPLPVGSDLLTAITSTMLCFGMGASSYALFARLGGGIYTKAADVGADLVGKVEAGMPEDDPRNPAAIADLVGDNVGDVAGMGADLFESYVDSIIAAMVLGVTVIGIFGKSAVWLPLTLAATGIIASLIGNIVVKFYKKGHPHKILNAGIFTAAGVMLVASFFINEAC